MITGATAYFKLRPEQLVKNQESWLLFHIQVYTNLTM